MAVTELTVGDYRACLASGGCLPPAPPESLASLRCSSDLSTFTLVAQDQEDLPMNCLLWSEAQAACRAQGGRLLFEAEWERAARGRDGRFFPWGNSTPRFCAQGANFAGPDCSGKPWRITAPTALEVMRSSPFGGMDLAGNLSEWTADYFAEDGYAACAAGCTDPQGPALGFLRVRRGGSFASPASELHSYAREFHVPEGPRSALVGARCAFAPKAFAN